MFGPSKIPTAHHLYHWIPPGSGELLGNSRLRRCIHNADPNDKADWHGSMNEELGLPRLPPSRVFRVSVAAEVVFAIPREARVLQQQIPVHSVEMREIVEEIDEWGIKDRVNIGEYEGQAAVGDRLRVKHQMSDVLLSVIAVRDVAPVDGVQHRRPRGEVEGNVVV
jgi:hypothetical protein